MIIVFAGADERVNGEVRDWLRFHGFYYFPLCQFVKSAKGVLGGTQRDVLVVEERGGKYWERMRVREGSWEERDEVSRVFRVREKARGGE